jgi:hypothetical protein
MKPYLTATAVIVVLLVSGLAASSAIPADPIPRPGSEPSLTTFALLEKTIFKVDVLALELWLGPETVKRLTHLLPVQDDDRSREAVARIALDSRDAWAELVFKRGISLDQFLGGIDENMRRARDAGLITPEGYERVATGLPLSYAPCPQMALLKVTGSSTGSPATRCARFISGWAAKWSSTRPTSGRNAGYRFWAAFS